MSRAPREPRPWETEPDTDALLAELRGQIARVKDLMDEHRAQMRAAGLTREPPPPPER
jgi:hypothetical protein